MSVNPYDEIFTVRGYEVDASNLVCVQSLCDYAQEAAGNHAAVLNLSIERMQAEGYTWVLSRLQLAPGVYPAAGSSVHVHTWPVGVEGLQYRRDFVMTSATGEIVATAISHWVIVNLRTRKVSRIPEFVADIQHRNPREAMADAKRRLPLLGADDEQCRFRARLGDMDRNRHVNNVRYVDWVLQTVPGALRDSASLCFMEMVFRAESVQGDSVSARCAAVADALPPGHAAGFTHSLVREGDEKELVRAYTAWR